jgi:serine/threonine protein kinase
MYKPYIRSPERITGTTYSFSSDLWSFGLVLYELYTLTYPYNSKGGSLELIDSITQYPEPTIISSPDTAMLHDFLCKM